MKRSVCCPPSPEYYQPLKEMGFDGVDLPFASNKDLSVPFTEEYENHLVLQKEALERAGLAILQSHLTYFRSSWVKDRSESYFDLYRERMLPVYRRELDLARKLGITHSVCHLYFDDDRERTREKNCQLLRELLPMAEESGVVLAIENIYSVGKKDAHLNGAEDFSFYLDAFPSPNLTACLDTGHAVCRGVDPVETVLALGDRLGALHVHTSLPRQDLHAIPTSIAGDPVCWEDFAKALTRISFRGSLNLEIRVKPSLDFTANLAFLRYAAAVSQWMLEKK